MLFFLNGSVYAAGVEWLTVDRTNGGEASLSFYSDSTVFNRFKSEKYATEIKTSLVDGCSTYNGYVQFGAPGSETPDQGFKVWIDLDDKSFELNSYQNYNIGVLSGREDKNNYVEFSGKGDSSLTLNGTGKTEGEQGNKYGIQVESRGILEINGIKNVEIHDSEVGVFVSSALSTAEGQKNNRTYFSLENASNFTISNKKGKQMRRGIFSTGDANVDIKTDEAINIHISEAWDQPCPTCVSKNDQLGAGLVVGNGRISLSSKKISLIGFSDDSAYGGYDESYAIQGLVSIIQERNCGLGAKAEETDSEIRLEAVDSIFLNTNWGGISSESNENYFSKVFLQARDIQLISAGTVGQEEVEEKGYDADIHAGIRAIARNQTSSDSAAETKDALIDINGGSVSINYSRDDLLDSESSHDMLYAWGSSALININAETLQLNGGVDGTGPAAVRNVAFADQNGKIFLNAGVGFGVDSDSLAYQAGSMSLYGNLTARSAGSIEATFDSRSIYVGAAFDNSFVHYSVENEEYFHYSDKGTIDLKGDGGAKWIVKKYAPDNGIEFKLDKPEYSTIHSLTAVNSSKENPYIVDLTTESSVQSLRIL